jgi:hypothetical protein
MHRDNLSGAESKELIAKAMKMISDWKNDLIPPEQAHTTNVITSALTTCKNHCPNDCGNC